MAVTKSVTYSGAAGTGTTTVQIDFKLAINSSTGVITATLNDVKAKSNLTYNSSAKMWGKIQCKKTETASSKTAIRTFDSNSTFTMSTNTLVSIPNATSGAITYTGVGYADKNFYVDITGDNVSSGSYKYYFGPYGGSFNFAWTCDNAAGVSNDNRPIGTDATSKGNAKIDFSSDFGKLTYNYNYTGSTSTTIYGESGTSVTLPSPTRTGYTFNGWYTAASGGTKKTSYSLSAGDQTLYAHWSPTTYTVSYNANGGSGAPSAQTKEYGKTLTLSTTIPTRSSTSLGVYTVTFNGNGGTSGSSSLTAARTRNYTFSTWNTKSGGSGTNYNAGSKYTANDNATLYAQWTQADSTAQITLPTATRSGYTFDGWYTAASGGTRKGGYNDKITPTGDTTLYAHWTAINYTINLTAGDYIDSVSGAGSYAYNSQVTVSATLGSATGWNYSFDGWYSGNNRESSSINYRFIVSGAKSLTAKGTRTPVQYSLSISTNTGTIVTVTRNFSNKEGASLGDLSDGDPIYYGDKITVTYTADTGYQIATHTINGSDLVSEREYTITNTTSIVVEAELQEFILGISTDNGVNTVVTRTSSPIGGGSLTTLSNGATLYYNDIIEIIYNTNPGFDIDTHTLNGEDFESGISHTVENSVSIVITTSASGFIYINSRPYIIYIGAGTDVGWKRYQAYIGNGSDWIPY